MKTRLLLPALVFAIPFAVYALTLAPTITWRNNGADGAELAAAAYTLGIAHPPGYPLYTLLGYLFTKISAGDVAYRLNLMSAIFGAGACLWAYLVAQDVLSLFASRQAIGGFQLQAAAFAAAILYGFSPILWGQATIAEVYTLHAFLAGLLAWLGVRWVLGAYTDESAPRMGRSRFLYAVAFLFGLGLGNHPTLLLLLPSVILWIQAGARLQAKEALNAGIFVAIGLWIYAYLPLRAAAHPALNWGDPEGWDGFWWLVSGQLYRPYLFSVPSNLLWERVTAWVSLLVQQFTAIGFVVGIVGLIGLLSRERRWALPSLLYFLLVSLFAITYNTSDSYLYLIPAYLFFAIWMAGGIFWLFGFAAEWAKPGFFQRRLDVALVVLLSLILPLGSLASRWGAQDLSADRSASEYARGVLDSVDKDAIVIAETDEHLFSLWYMQYVENRRTDVAIVAAGLLDYAWYRRNLRRLYPGVVLRETPDNTPRLWTFVQDNLYPRTIYLTDPNPTVRAAFLLLPYGNVLRVQPRE